MPLLDLKVLNVGLSYQNLKANIHNVCSFESKLASISFPSWNFTLKDELDKSGCRKLLSIVLQRPSLVDPILVPLFLALVAILFILVEPFGQFCRGPLVIVFSSGDVV